MGRKYEMRRRAERIDDTRRRIAKAVHDLHATVGPARATVSAIAEQAGVDRVTVYRHFPNELSLYRACLEHWSTERPLPNPEGWRSAESAEDRLRVGLGQLYRHYEENEGLWSNGWRDIPRLPLLAEADAPVFETFARMQAVLVEPWPARPIRARRVVEAWVGHAMEFPTWESFLRRQGLSPDQLLDLMVDTARCLARSSGGQRC